MKHIKNIFIEKSLRQFIKYTKNIHSSSSKIDCALKHSLSVEIYGRFSENMYCMIPTI